MFKCQVSGNKSKYLTLGTSHLTPVPMPAIDLARLRKQANRVADFFFLPEDFLKHLRETLELYVNHSLRSQGVAPSSVLPTYRTPTVVLRQIETELGPIAEKNPEQALVIADALWDEGYLETRLLAAFLLGRIPPHEELLLARLTAWTQQIRDPSVRAALLTTSLTRIRRETPDQFLTIVREWTHPNRQRMWANGLQALVPLIASSDFENLPPIFEIVEPILEAAPGALQNDLKDVIVALFKASPDETIFFLRQTLEDTGDPLIAVTLRRIFPDLPRELQDNLRDLIRKSK